MSNDTKTPSHQTRRSFYVVWIGLAAVALIAAVGVVKVRGQMIRKQAGELQNATGRGQPVLVTAVVRTPQSREISLPGEIHGYYETPIYGKIPGYVKNMLVDKGSQVRAGELVATIESPETDQQTRNAKASYEIAAITNRRYQNLLSQQVVPKQTADQTKSQMLETYATWRSYVATQQYERVLAPFDGMITARNLDPGALVGSAAAAGTSSPAIFEIATLKPLRVYLYVPQPLSPLLHNGDQAVVSVSEYPKRDFAGVITRHPSALDQSTRTMQIEVDLPNDDLALYPGMYATVKVSVRGSNESPKVPDEALIFDNEDVLVPVVRSNRIHLAKVALGLDDGINCEVTRGLNGDETIALGLGQTAREGELVEPISASKKQ
ncbi:MAG TPA: efflux RND transporter periplasmic adaptor subunit [Candidatus Binataceae bacterium]|nr:efflux RND transporter periplasmic adaptor subunit [Candidatus Binataceae bacterium]